MKKVSVDKAAMTVTAQGGCIARDIEQPCEAEGLSAVFRAVSKTGEILLLDIKLKSRLIAFKGIGGLTLGGGVGFLTGCHSLTLDNLLSARLVLASGEIVSVSDDENTNLFWAIRGGGGNVRIVTEFKFRAYKQGPVFSYVSSFRTI